MHNTLVACIKVRDRHAMCCGRALLLLLVIGRTTPKFVHTSGMLRLWMSDLRVGLLLAHDGRGAIATS